MGESPHSSGGSIGGGNSDGGVDNSGNNSGDCIGIGESIGDERDSGNIIWDNVRCGGGNGGDNVPISTLLKHATLEHFKVLCRPTMKSLLSCPSASNRSQCCSQSEEGNS